MRVHQLKSIIGSICDDLWILEVHLLLMETPSPSVVGTLVHVGVVGMDAINAMMESVANLYLGS